MIAVAMVTPITSPLVIAPVREGEREREGEGGREREEERVVTPIITIINECTSCSYVISNIIISDVYNDDSRYH